MARAVIVVAVSLAGLTACATSPVQPGRKSSASIDSHRSTGFDGGVARLLVLLARSDHPDEDTLLRTDIQQELQKRHVAAVVVTVSATTVDAPQPLASAELADQRRAIRVLGPTAIMRIKLASAVADTTHPQWRPRMTYELGLYAMSSGVVAERVWHAELEHSGPERATEKRFSLAVACLMERLDAERILASDSD